MVAPAGSARLVTARAGLIGSPNKNQARLKEKSKLSARLSRVRQLSLARHYFLPAGGRCPVARLFCPDNPIRDERHKGPLTAEMYAGRCTGVAIRRSPVHHVRDKRGTCPWGRL